MDQNELQKLMLEIKDKVTRVETKLDTYNDYNKKTDSAYNMACGNSKDIEEIKDSLIWLWRTIAGAIIIGAVGATIFFK